MHRMSPNWTTQSRIVFLFICLAFKTIDNAKVEVIVSDNEDNNDGNPARGIMNVLVDSTSICNTTCLKPMRRRKCFFNLNEFKINTNFKAENPEKTINFKMKPTTKKEKLEIDSQKKRLKPSIFSSNLKELKFFLYFYTSTRFQDPSKLKNHQKPMQGDKYRQERQLKKHQAPKKKIYNSYNSQHFPSNSTHYYYGWHRGASCINQTNSIHPSLQLLLYFNKSSSPLYFLLPYSSSTPSSLSMSPSPPPTSTSIFNSKLPFKPTFLLKPSVGKLKVTSKPLMKSQPLFLPSSSSSALSASLSLFQPMVTSSSSQPNQSFIARPQSSTISSLSSSLSSLISNSFLPSFTSAKIKKSSKADLIKQSQLWHKMLMKPHLVQTNPRILSKKTLRQQKEKQKNTIKNMSKKDEVVKWEFMFPRSKQSVQTTNLYKENNTKTQMQTKSHQTTLNVHALLIQLTKTSKKKTQKIHKNVLVPTKPQIADRLIFSKKELLSNIAIGQLENGFLRKRKVSNDDKAEEKSGFNPERKNTRHQSKTNISVLPKTIFSIKHFLPLNTKFFSLHNNLLSTFPSNSSKSPLDPVSFFNLKPKQKQLNFLKKLGKLLKKRSQGPQAATNRPFSIINSHAIKTFFIRFPFNETRFKSNQSFSFTLLSSLPFLSTLQPFTSSSISLKLSFKKPFSTSYKNFSYFSNKSNKSISSINLTSISSNPTIPSSPPTSPSSPFYLAQPSNNNGIKRSDLNSNLILKPSNLIKNFSTKSINIPISDFINKPAVSVPITETMRVNKKGITTTSTNNAKHIDTFPKFSTDLLDSFKQNRTTSFPKKTVQIKILSFSNTTLNTKAFNTNFRLIPYNLDSNSFYAILTKSLFKEKHSKSFTKASVISASTTQHPIIPTNTSNNRKNHPFITPYHKSKDFYNNATEGTLFHHSLQTQQFSNKNMGNSENSFVLNNDVSLRKNSLSNEFSKNSKMNLKNGSNFEKYNNAKVFEEKSYSKPMEKVKKILKNNSYIPRSNKVYTELGDYNVINSEYAFNSCKATTTNTSPKPSQSTAFINSKLSGVFKITDINNKHKFNKSFDALLHKPHQFIIENFNVTLKRKNFNTSINSMKLKTDISVINYPIESSTMQFFSFLRPVLPSKKLPKNVENKLERMKPDFYLQKKFRQNKLKRRCSACSEKLLQKAKETLTYQKTKHQTKPAHDQRLQLKLIKQSPSRKSIFYAEPIQDSPVHISKQSVLSYENSPLNNKINSEKRFKKDILGKRKVIFHNEVLPQKKATNLFDLPQNDQQQQLNDCPARCFCSYPSYINFCSKRNFTQLPSKIPVMSLQLNINENHFESGKILKVNFTKYYHGLRQLYLSDCNIRYIEAKAFQKLTKLKWLDVSKNLITVSVTCIY